MNKERVWIGTNWKMHKSLAEGLGYTAELLQWSRENRLDPIVELFIIPPYTSLWPIKEVLRGGRVMLGAQNMHWADEGAYTGEISPAMLAEIGLDLVELGHSERRQYYNENDWDINKKVHAALKYRMRPLVCIGENIRQKEAGVTLETIFSQLKIGLHAVSAASAERLLIAYEPVWSIGAAGVPAEPEAVAQVHRRIREFLAERFGDAGYRIPVLYGGSVNPENAMSYLRYEDVTGLFIGRSAWNMESFRAILNDVQAYVRGT